jgi:hypothetical protein
MQGVDYYQVVLIAHYPPANLDPRITFKKCKDTELASKDPKNTNDYSKFMLYNLCDYIESDYTLIVHNDAYVLRPHKWEDKFLNTITSARHFEKRAFYERRCRGACRKWRILASKQKMLTIFNELNLPFTDNGPVTITKMERSASTTESLLEDKGIKFAPTDLAARFALEKVVKETVWDPFGFHNNKGAIPEILFCKI